MYRFSLPIYLASHSPRRLDLLARFGIPFTPLSHDADEKSGVSSDPGERVRSLAEKKARAASAGVKKGVVLAFDTVVFLDGNVLEKPGGPAGAFSMLSSLSGRTHVVYTGMARLVLPAGRCRLYVEKTRVKFRKLEATEIKNYIKTGEPLDKAGAYGIQGAAGAFIERIEGCFFNVVGLPVKPLMDCLKPYMV